MNDVTIEYGQTDQDCLDVHLLLCLLMKPQLLAEIDPDDSIAGIMQVRDDGAFIVARKEGHLIGSLGLIKMPWWYNSKAFFLTNRWFSVLPQFKHAGIGVQLEAEAAVIGMSCGLPVVISSHAKRRKAAAPTEPSFMRDHVAVPAET